MNLTSRVSHPSTTARPRPEDLLGTHHPLVRDLERLDVARSQFVIVAGALAAGVGLLVTHSAAGIALTVAAVIVELVIACRIGALVAGRRIHVLRLVAEGRADLPIPIIERTCTQLRACRHRQRLVRGVETLLAPCRGKFDSVVVPWQFASPELVAGVHEDLRHITALLRASDAHVAGVALMEQLLSDGTSRLHGNDPQMLREELGRVRYLLAAGSARA